LYLVVPVLALLLFRRSQRGLLVTAVAAVGASFLLMATRMWVGTIIYPPSPDSYRLQLMMGANPIERLPEFMIGVALGIWFARGGRLPRSGLIAVLCVALVVVIDASGRLIGGTFGRTQFLLPIFGLLILALASGQGMVARFLARPGVTLLGKASYALYLLHASLSPLTKTYIFNPGGDRQAGTGFIGVVLFFVAYFIGAIAISVAVFKWIEEPARHAIRGWDERRRRLKAAMPAVDSPA
jgi:peptidoglycan/LPS O-acetylase OafA/YrhL